VKYTKETAKKPATILEIKTDIFKYIKIEKIPKSIAKPRPEKIVNPNNFIDFDLLIKSLSTKFIFIFKFN
tara:strand:+ start:1940 stop:2149 length:210 start_codon:yes stop_codon:yes gene_type:complete